MGQIDKLSHSLRAHPNVYTPLVTKELDLYGIIPEAVLSEKCRSFVDGSTTRFVIVEQVAPQQDHVHFLRHCVLQDLLESHETVVTAYRILLQVAQVII